MFNLELDAVEAKALHELLKQHLSDMSVEIAGTDRKAYRDEIKGEREILQHIFDRLEEFERAA